MKQGRRQIKKMLQKEILPLLNVWRGVDGLGELKTEFNLPISKFYSDIIWLIWNQMASVSLHKLRIMIGDNQIYYIEKDSLLKYNVFAYKNRDRKMFSSDDNYRSCAEQARLQGWEKIELLYESDILPSSRDGL